MNNDLITKTGNKFPVFNFGSDLMNLKFLLVLTMVLCTFCVFPVYALTSYEWEIDCSYEGSYFSKTETKNLGNIPYDSNLILTVKNYDIADGVLRIEYSGGNIIFPYQQDSLSIPLTESPETFKLYMIHPLTQNQHLYDIQCSVIFNYERDKDIIVEDNENIINLGDINNLNQRFTIGSNQNGEILLYNSYVGINCTIDELKTGYIDVRLDENFKNARINLIGDIDYNGNIDSFNTHALIYYNYTKPELPTNEITAYIQTYDYQSGNMVSGVNISIYEVIDHDTYAELGTKVFSSISAESQIILQLKNNTDYFIKNELNGYLAVKNTEYPYFNGEMGYWWNSIDNPLRLYYSRLDENAQYNANFIVQDVNNNGISGVSVTMDNAVTKVTNSIGGLSFSNVTAGTHTFTFIKNGYQTAQRTINIQMQYATFTQTLFKDNQIVQPTVSPTAYPTVSPTVQPTISPIDQPTNLGESIKYGLAKMFGVNSLNTINLIFALLIILFPAVVGAVVTNQALGFISGGLIGFVFALGIGLIPIWVFFSMIMLSVIYLVMTHTEAGF